MWCVIIMMLCLLPIIHSIQCRTQSIPTRFLELETHLINIQRVIYSTRRTILTRKFSTSVEENHATQPERQSEISRNQSVSRRSYQNFRNPAFQEKKLERRRLDLLSMINQRICCRWETVATWNRKHCSPHPFFTCE